MILAVCAAEIAGMAGYASFIAQAPLLSETWALTSSGAGWISGAFYGGYALAVPFLVTFTDRFGPLRIYRPAMLATGFGALGFALLAEGFWSASLFQVLMGAGLAGTYMPGLRLLTDRLGGVAQSRAAAIYTASYALGAGFSFALIGWLSQWLDWRWAIGVAAAGPLAAFLTITLLFDESPRAAPSQAPATRDILAVLRDRAVLARSIAYGAHNLELFGYWSWAVAFLTFAYASSPASAFHIEPSLVTAVLILLLLPASVVGNEIALRFGRRRWIVAVMIGSAGLAPFVGISSAFEVPWALLLLCIFYGIAVSAESGALTASVIAVAEPRLRGAAMAVYSTIGFAGAAAGPAVFGLVLTGFSVSSVTGWTAAFAALGLGALVGPVAMLVVDRPPRPACPANLATQCD